MSKKTEPEEIEQEYKTEEFDRIRLTGGKLPVEGVVMVPLSMETKTGSNGEFRVVKMTMDGKDGDLVFSSSKMMKIWDAGFEKFKDRRIRVSGRGEGFSRQYSVAVLK